MNQKPISGCQMLNKINLLVLFAAFGNSSLLISDDLNIRGDLRYRHEQIDREGEVKRDRQRVRARLSLSRQVDETLKIGFRLASGGNDPVSTNQTLDGGFSNKGIQLDMAYFEAKPFKYLTVVGGKMKNPFATNSQLIWDGDMTPEGIAVMFPINLDTLKVEITGAQYWVEENSSADDIRLNAAQLVVGYKGDEFSTELGGSYYQYNNIKGSVGVFKPTDFFGNTSESYTDSKGNTYEVYSNEYHLSNLFLSAKFSPGGIPVKIFAEMVENQKAKENEKGSSYGFSVGAGKYGKTPWKLKVEHKKVEKDATLGVFSDSDFGGGGTDSEGNIISASYALSKAASVGYTFFDNIQNPDDSIKKKKYKRHQLDLKYKF